MKKTITFILAAIILLGVTNAFIFYHCGFWGHHVTLVKTQFDYLPGWQEDNHQQALVALQKSCLAISKLKPNGRFKRSIPQAGKVKDWQKICWAIDQLAINDDLMARRFFEFFFEPYRIYDNFSTKGLFTGYYLPTLKCSLTQDEHYSIPVYATPDDWVKVDLGVFDQGVKDRVIVGQIKNKQVRPYPKRAAISKGDISQNAQVLAWCDDKIDVAFAEIQGSAIIQLPNQEQFLINYEASNGRPYTSIGKILIKNKCLTREKSSMQDIRAWFLQHPDKVDSILNKNASYVFFRILEGSDPIGSQQVPLTPGRTLAVDKSYIPMGMPIWLDTEIPNNNLQVASPLRRLLIAQDTGGAIKGIIRGDVYWGGGDQAVFIAGHMKNSGSYWLLLPRNLD